MDVDLSQFNQVFFDEIAEHLAEMERIYLAIDPANPRDEELNALFLAAHSIKGGAGTFGFPDMTVLPHTLETLLDLVRHHEMPLTWKMVAVFLQAGDAISMQLAGHRDGSRVDQQIVENVCEQLCAISASSRLPADQTDQEIQTDHDATIATYRIIFTPPSDLYTRMVRLEPIFEELAAMGNFTVSAVIEPHREFSAYAPTQCRIIWEMTLTTALPESDVAEVFMFVADEEEISIEQLQVWNQ